MTEEIDKFEKDYFRDSHKEYRRQQKEEKEREAKEREAKERIERLEEIRRRGKEKSLRTTGNIYPGYPHADENELSDEEFHLICNLYDEPSTPNEFARKHGFLNRHDRDRFIKETKGYYFLQKLNYLVENADEYGLTESIYYLNGVSSDNSVKFAEAIVESCLNEIPKKTYAELKEELETIHDNMIMDVEKINEIVSQGKSRQWNNTIHRSIDGVEFCVFNQLKYESQKLRAIAFAICHRKWNIFVDVPFDESVISEEESYISDHLNDKESPEC